MAHQSKCRALAAGCLSGHPNSAGRSRQRETELRSDLYRGTVSSAFDVGHRFLERREFSELVVWLGRSLQADVLAYADGSRFPRLYRDSSRLQSVVGLPET